MRTSIKSGVLVKILFMPVDDVDVDEAEADVDEAEADVDEAEADVDEAEADVEDIIRPTMVSKCITNGK